MKNFLLWLSQYNKAFVAVTMAIVYWINAQYGVELPVDESSVMIIWGVITSLITFYVPNTKPEDVK